MRDTAEHCFRNPITGLNFFEEYPNTIAQLQNTFFAVAPELCRFELITCIDGLKLIATMRNEELLLDWQLRKYVLFSLSLAYSRESFFDILQIETLSLAENALAALTVHLQSKLKYETLTP